MEYIKGIHFPKAIACDCCAIGTPRAGWLLQVHNTDNPALNPAEYGRLLEPP